VKRAAALLVPLPALFPAGAQAHAVLEGSQPSRALAAYAPPSSAGGPFSAEANLGPAQLELTVDPARLGPNQIHLYLFDRRTGAQFDRVKELTLSARLPEHRVGPLHFEPHKAGPGHWIVRRADLAPAGDWRLDLSARVSAFDAYTTRIEVPVE
jgi:copper transport protein